MGNMDTAASAHEVPPKKPCRVCSDFQGWAKKQKAKTAQKENVDAAKPQPTAEEANINPPPGGMHRFSPKRFAALIISTFSVK
jgi:hypothetical protein